MKKILFLILALCSTASVYAKTEIEDIKYISSNKFKIKSLNLK